MSKAEFFSTNSTTRFSSELKKLIDKQTNTTRADILKTPSILMMLAFSAGVTEVLKDLNGRELHVMTQANPEAEIASIYSIVGVDKSLDSHAHFQGVGNTEADTMIVPHDSGMSNTIEMIRKLVSVVIENVDTFYGVLLTEKSETPQS